MIRDVRPERGSFKETGALCGSRLCREGLQDVTTEGSGCGPVGSEPPSSNMRLDRLLSVVLGHKRAENLQRFATISVAKSCFQKIELFD